MLGYPVQEQSENTGISLAKGHKGHQGLCPMKRRLHGDPSIRFWNTWCIWGKEDGFFLVVPSDTARGNRHKQKYMKYHLNFRKIFLLQGWMSTVTGFPVVEPSSLERVTQTTCAVWLCSEQRGWTGPLSPWHLYHWNLCLDRSPKNSWNQSEVRCDELNPGWEWNTHSSEHPLPLLWLLLSSLLLHLSSIFTRTADFLRVFS